MKIFSSDDISFLDFFASNPSHEVETKRTKVNIICYQLKLRLKEHLKAAFTGKVKKSGMAA